MSSLSYILSQSTQQIRCPVIPSIFLTGGKNPQINTAMHTMKAESTYQNTETNRLIICAPSDSAQALLPWESQSFTNSLLPLTADFNGGMPCSFKELCNFLTESSDKQYFKGDFKTAYTAYSQPIFMSIFYQETE